MSIPNSIKSMASVPLQAAAAAGLRVTGFRDLSQYLGGPMLVADEILCNGEPVHRVVVRLDPPVWRDGSVPLSPPFVTVSWAATKVRTDPRTEVRLTLTMTDDGRVCLASWRQITHSETIDRDVAQASAMYMTAFAQHWESLHLGVLQSVAEADDRLVRFAGLAALDGSTGPAPYAEWGVVVDGQEVKCGWWGTDPEAAP